MYSFDERDVSLTYLFRGAGVNGPKPTPSHEALLESAEEAVIHVLFCHGVLTQL